MGANDARPVDATLAARLSALFRSFADELAGRDAEEAVDADVQDALETLGYVR